jgi:hypothetical protein
MNVAACRWFFCANVPGSISSAFVPRLLRDLAALLPPRNLANPPCPPARVAAG